MKVPLLVRRRACWPVTTLTVLGLWILVGAAPSSARADAQASADLLVILVSKESPVTSLDLETVRDLFLGRTPTLHAIPGLSQEEGDDARIRLFLSADAEEPFTRQLLDLSPRRFRKRWVKTLLSGSAAHGPETVATCARVGALVAGDTGAFGVCRAGEVPPGVRTLELAPLWDELAVESH